MDIQGLLVWVFRSAGDLLQLIMPILILSIAVLWCRAKDSPLCYWGLAGAVIALIGRVAQWTIPSVSWTFLSNVEYVPSGNTTALEAIVYLAFPALGQGIFLIAVLVYFFKVRCE